MARRRSDGIVWLVGLAAIGLAMGSRRTRSEDDDQAPPVDPPRRRNVTASTAQAPTQAPPLSTAVAERSDTDATRYEAALGLKTYWENGGRDRTRIAMYQRLLGVRDDGRFGPDTTDAAEALGVTIHTIQTAPH